MKNGGRSLEATRRSFNKDFLLAFSDHFKHEGPKVIAKVARQQPAAYLKALVMLVPKEMKVEHQDGIKAMTDEQLDQALAALRQLLADREAAAAGQLVDASPALPVPDVIDVKPLTAEPVVFPAPEAQSPEATPA